MDFVDIWRRGRDSNPRYPFGHAGFQDRSHQPLGHLSGDWINILCLPNFLASKAAAQNEPPGLKPILIPFDLRGPEGPLFHSDLRSLVGCAYARDLRERLVRSSTADLRNLTGRSQQCQRRRLLPQPVDAAPFHTGSNLS